MNKLVLISGGIDSTVLLHKVVKEYQKNSMDDVIGLTIFYGQKHAIELEYAKYQCLKLNVHHIISDLSPMFKYNLDVSSLLQGSKLNIVHKSYEEQLQNNSGPVSTYVPYRNGLFLSFATVVALQLNCDSIYFGAHLNDSYRDSYPDCSIKFIQAQSTAIFQGTTGKVSLETPWWKMSKSEIIAEGLTLGMTAQDFFYTWSCYEYNEKTHCNTCATCMERNKALQANNLSIK